ncbi:hypothetical protein [Vulcanisaeta distributa]|uniref:hypothetical protein n=1 Tax=Vulcanisaeta distributa TaxID=164451 RepID=UPI001FB2D763|nr:hypothetical protein [Vulcanisaeta distributa]
MLGVFTTTHLSVRISINGVIGRLFLEPGSPPLRDEAFFPLGRSSGSAQRITASLRPLPSSVRLT